MKRLRAIIFDFDGVIIESVEAKGRIFAELFRNHTQHVENIVKYHMSNGGLSRFSKFEYIHREILAEPLSEARKRFLVDEFSKLSLKVMSESPFVRGAKELLKKYSKSLPLFVISGTPEVEIREVVTRRGLESCFCGVYGSPSGKGEHAANILRKFGLPPEEVYFVGDSVEDYRGALENGIDFIGRVRNGAVDVFEGCNLSASVRDMSELDAHLDRSCIFTS